MSNLKQMIKNEFDKDNGLATRLAQKVGLAGSSTLSKFVSIPERELESFNCLLAVVRELFPDQELELMSDYIMSLNPNKNTARVCLEYTEINKLDNVHEYLIDKMLNCSNKESREWAKAYKIENDTKKNMYSPIEAIDKIEETCVSSPEVKVFLNISKFYNYYDLRLIDLMLKMEPVLRSMIESIDDEYLQKTYLMRLFSLTIDIKLHTNDLASLRNRIESVEKYCESKQIKSSIYLMMGNSFIFESYSEAIKYMNKSLEIAIENKLENRIIQAKRSINFVQNYWGRVPLYLDQESNEISDLHEIAFFFARMDRNEESLEILNQINIDELTNAQKGFHYFYRGLATNSKEYFFKSLKHFNIDGEQFYKNLPIIELKKQGVEDYILDAFIN